ncbi:MAG TPA: TIGR03619 family F420-dependent LLM class oxidoreductase [Mycobacteriales bacterium]|nr:TIGR03619 family F420-dependent LLM class oxidoreductase [Mycobacteriales bacterium]
MISIGFMAGGPGRRAAELEQLPIDSLWVGGHVASRNPSPEAMVQLARLAAVTERVRIGTAVLLLPLYAPAIVAKQVADLDRDTGGRVTLGVGIGGEYPAEFRACGVPIGERAPRCDEAIPLLRTLWSGESVSHDGRYYPMQDVRIHPAPVQPGGPPIVIAGRKGNALRRVALLGDGWIPYLCSPRRYAESAAEIRAIAAAANRDLSGFGWHVFVFVNVGRDGRQAREATARSLGGLYDKDFAAMVDSVTASGTVDEVAEKLSAFVDAGARHFVFLPACDPGDADTVIDRLLSDVIPAVRR